MRFAKQLGPALDTGWAQNKKATRWGGFLAQRLVRIAATLDCKFRQPMAGFRAL